LPYGLDEDGGFDIRLCVEEAVRNAIVHGNHSDRKRSVKVDCRVENGAAIIEVEDEGAGFDYNNVPDPTKESNILKNSGRGVYLIKKLMDKVEFNKAGNRIKMVKGLKRR
jgi:serine/threonine-protein kinase RsbW